MTNELRAAIKDNETLMRVCLEAAMEIVADNLADQNKVAISQTVNYLAAIIYKHMRNGREL